MPDNTIGEDSSSYLEHQARNEFSPIGYKCQRCKRDCRTVEDKQWAGFRTSACCDWPVWSVYAEEEEEEEKLSLVMELTKLAHVFMEAGDLESGERLVRIAAHIRREQS